MVEKYCDYNKAEWVRQYDGLKNSYYKTKIEGNTIYIISRGKRRVPVYKKIIGNLYRLINKTEEKEEKIVCHLGMCKMHETTLLEVLESYGFDLKEVKYG